MLDSHVFHRQLHRPQPVAVRASGMHVFDSQGKRYLDGVGGVAVNIIGHGVTEITEGIASRADELSFTYGAVFSNPWQEELAERLVSLSPFTDASVYFASGGSEANEVAIKLARQYHLERGHGTKWKVISRRQSYHGNTIAMANLSGRPSWRRGFDPYFFDVPKISAPYSYRAPTSIDSTKLLEFWMDEFEAMIFHEGAETISAFIAEPIIGSSLVGVVPPTGYYEGIRKICDRHDILFVADEVFSGYGRTGANFAIDHWKVLPDIITAGKGVGSGYVPISACILSPGVDRVIRAGTGMHTQGFTFSGSAFACFIGVQVNTYVREHALIERSAALGRYLHNALQQLYQTCPAIGDVRGKGLLAGIELVADRDSKTPFSVDLNVAQRIVDRCAESGLLLLAGSPNAGLDRGGDLLQITPPFIITETQVDDLVSLLGDAIEQVTAPLC